MSATLATATRAPAATVTSEPVPTAVATIKPADDDSGNTGINIVVVLIGGGIAFFAIRSWRTI